MSFLKFDNEEEFINDLKITLGHPVIRVELDDSHWLQVIKKTKRWFFAKKSLIAITSKKSYVSCQGPIPFSQIDTVNGCYKVLDVLFDSTDAGIRGYDATYYDILPFGFPLWGSSTEIFGTSAYNRTSYAYQVFESIERRKRMYGTELGWFVQEDDMNGHQLVLTPSQRCREYMVVYKPKALPISKLEGRNAQLFFDWGLAEAKEMLGMIRSKYKDYPAAGGNISTDGAELLDAAKELKEKLTEEIADSQYPMGVILG